MKRTLLLSLFIFTNTFLVSAQEREISGTVTADDGTGPFLGATVLVKGTSLGTTTDMDGAYTISVPPENDTLVFSAIGVETLEEVIGGRTTIDVQLATKTTELNEVVIT
ncbi:MAG: carboxypeptidase-like regulatory domain-containing protein, partial [Pricia sp.]